MSTKHFRSIALALSLALSAVTAFAQIYQWKDEHGKTVISDKPPVGNVPVAKKAEGSTHATTPAAKQPSLADRDMEFRKRQKEAQEKSEKSQKDATTASERSEQCEKARRQLQALDSGERISARDDKGERYFLDDEQRAHEQASTQRFLDTQCK